MGWRAVLIFGARRDPSGRLAGLPLAARAAGEAVAAGASEIWLAVERGDVPSPVRLEIERICAGIPFHLVTRADLRDRLEPAGYPPAIRLYCDRYILLAGPLGRFAAGDGGRLVCGADIVAERNGGRVEAAAESDVLDLDRPGAAARKILAATTKPSDGIVSRRLNRPISQRVSAALLRIEGIRPWHLTVFTATMGLVMFACFLQAGPAGLALGGILFHVASVVDGIDGEIARATHRTSERGAMLDTAVDMITNLLFYLGVTVSLARLHGPVHLLVGGWCLLVAILGLLLIRTFAERVGDRGNFDIIKIYYRGRFPDGVMSRLGAFTVAITSRDFFAFGNALIILSGWGMLVTWLLAGWATLWLALIVAAAPALLRGGRPSVPAGLPSDGPIPALRDI
ncbi:MAG TPA: CDP-alcohol phosphatidyltransferase family protein [Allosphingosinicella sp.]|nr:CDP-alcohol phosphatidyltransferase family protein [Allosphingosinicella sp.]